MSYTVPDNSNNHHDEIVSSDPNGGGVLVDNGLNKNDDVIAVTSQTGKEDHSSPVPVAENATVSAEVAPTTTHSVETSDASAAVLKVPSTHVAEGGVVTTAVPSDSSEAASDDGLFTKKKRSCWGRNGSFMTALTSKSFYIVLILGQCLALGTTSTNTFSTLLVNQGTSIPAFQSFFNYILLTLVYTSYTIYRYGFKGWLRLIYKDGWKYVIFSFCDVEGNYFVVLSYNYTTILSAQLINFWAIAMVVIVSFLLLKVKYHWAQIFGILVCIGGMGVLFGSDHITGANASGHISTGRQIKGDIFALIGATFYGLSNVTEEYFVSTRPLYEVLGQMGIYGMIINGVQAGIFDRHGFRDATWNGKVGGYLTGYTIVLFLFYSFAPLLFRLASAAFFNISLLTANFWGVIIGVRVFHYHVHWMYPIAFVMIIIGQLIYFIGRQVFGDESFKPWLGKDQEKGVDGFGTAKHKKKHQTEGNRLKGFAALKNKIRRPRSAGQAVVNGDVAGMPMSSTDPSQVDLEAGEGRLPEDHKYGKVDERNVSSSSAVDIAKST
ncbi:hypothetical protein AAP_01116 [Ascosphaera apis ARSEF 7405]|uniref:DUF914 domain membrane protein n=1 Tax=Ascosphaera apis ARSEF 7405 TaxID=392613 RepID=A0A162IPA1_9EURO|nr:hypothetical protein AAP_01116 [Ascosphaera apis ARSEF 7405]